MIRGLAFGPYSLAEDYLLMNSTSLFSLIIFPPVYDFMFLLAIYLDSQSNNPCESRPHVTHLMYTLQELLANNILTHIFKNFEEIDDSNKIKSIHVQRDHMLSAMGRSVGDFQKVFFHVGQVRVDLSCVAPGLIVDQLEIMKKNGKKAEVLKVACFALKSMIIFYFWN